MHGQLAIADISGYTQFLTEGELEHAHEIIGDGGRRGSFAGRRLRRSGPAHDRDLPGHLRRCLRPDPRTPAALSSSLATHLVNPFRELNPVASLDLGQEVRNVGFHRAETDVELFGDFGVRMTVSKGKKDLFLGYKLAPNRAGPAGRQAHPDLAPSPRHRRGGQVPRLGARHDRPRSPALRSGARPRSGIRGTMAVAVILGFPDSSLPARHRQWRLLRLRSWIGMEPDTRGVDLEVPLAKANSYGQ